MEKLAPTYETINMEELGKFPLYNYPPTYRVSDSMGNGCYGDPPGYPTYFTKSIYTQHGNTPGKEGQASTLLLGRVVQRNWEGHDAVVHPRLHKLWKPLPYDHPRTRAWIESTYQHMAGCYQHENFMENGRMKTLCGYPDFGEFAHKQFHDDPRLSDEWRATARAEVDSYNAAMEVLWTRYAVPENHRAYQFVHKFYPEHVPDLELIANPPKSAGHWWQWLERKPEPEECPGEIGWGRGGIISGKHPVNGSRCQVCGWHEEVPA
jgi:hypothetical protein